ncbi:MAG: antitoxin [Verrucomicrobia bacterium]|nr:antitoxin [Verrucomicrobiota bacterium]
MRTTLTLDPDVAELAARQAKARGLSLGKTISELVRRGLNAPTSSKVEGGLVVFQLPADSPIVTTEDVRRLESEGA